MINKRPNQGFNEFIAIQAVIRILAGKDVTIKAATKEGAAQMEEKIKELLRRALRTGK